ncbi:right-handed parallel beta-helix repeat-containing protein [Microbacterium sp. WCS2018Hpa-9]|uniref:right-handed parallel beta-helix repeat-containing protein n=1 Tax=Microbacterium sp. WCS2018Hpa-9 TaxID=3073635 RepID=UPI00288B36F8|nr:right-handed parallel beta-helix repeat-containing protein [Microbacterium sp. WCS2018Hpa-9]
MSIYTDAVTAFQQVVDGAQAEYERRLADADQAITGLRTENATLLERIRELETLPPVVKVAGAVKLGTGYKIPADAIRVSASQSLHLAYAAAPSGATIVLEGAVHRVTKTLTLSKPVTIMADGEAWLDFEGKVQLPIVGKSKTSILGIGLRNGNTITTTDPNSGVTFASGSDGSLIENCVFEDFTGSWPVATRRGTGALNIYSNRDVTVRNCTFLRSGVCHIQSEKTTNLTIEWCKFEDANVSKQPMMQPVTAAMKHTRARNIHIAHNVVTGIPDCGGIWLDVYCYQYLIAHNTVTGSPGTEAKIEAELSGFGDIAFNDVTQGPAQYSIMVLDSNDTRVWGNKLNHGSAAQLEVCDDGRRNINDIHKAEGVTGEVRNVQIINNQFGPDYGYFQAHVWDKSTTPKPAETFATRVEGNGPAKWGWGRNTQSGGATVRQTRTSAQLDATYPAVARGNDPARPAATPADLST